MKYFTAQNWKKKCQCNTETSVKKHFVSLLPVCFFLLNPLLILVKQLAQDLSAYD